MSEDAADYVRSLRRLIGHELLLLPAVTAVIQIGGRILMMQHRNTRRWVFPGGCLEPGERPQEAVKREALEETGLAIQIERLIGVYSGPEFEVNYRNGDRCIYMMAVFGCTADGQTPVPSSEEAERIAFLDPGELAAHSSAPWVSVMLPDILAWLRARRDR